MKDLNRFYTYAYLRVDRSPYYVGKGQEYRLYEKYGREIKPPKDKSRIIFLKQNLTEQEAFKHEKYMIAVLGRKDLGTGILHNRTDGGEGSSGATRSEETRRKISKSRKGKCTGKDNPNYGKSPSEEQRKKQSEGMKGKYAGKNNHNYGKSLSKEHKEKLKNSISTEERIEIGRKNYEMKVGIHGLPPEETLKNAKKGGNTAKELGLGIHGRSKEEIIEHGKMGGLIGGKTTSSQRWECLETGFITNAGNLTKYQKKRGIDTSKRKRIS
jgi:hypothetical protein